MGKIYPENLDNLCNMQKGEYTFYQILSIGRASCRERVLRLV